MMSSIWLLTRELHEYERFGEYFIALWRDKPDAWELVDEGVPYDETAHVLNGGGRVADEDEWWMLREVPCDFQ